MVKLREAVCVHYLSPPKQKHYQGTAGTEKKTYCWGEVSNAGVLQEKENFKLKHAVWVGETDGMTLKKDFGCEAFQSWTLWQMQALPSCETPKNVLRRTKKKKTEDKGM